MVIHGPPGTGKSQTIANVISNLLARKKKVLFVCEKQVALDVVFKRLSFEDINVSDLCLPLFNYTHDKKSFAADIIESRDRVFAALRSNRDANLELKLKLRQKKIETLKKYGALITTPVAPLNKSIYWIFGELSKISDKSKECVLSWKGASALSFSLDDYFRAQSLVNELSGLTDLFEEKTRWISVNRKHYTIDFAQRVIETLKEIEGLLLLLGGQINTSLFSNLQTLRDAVNFLVGKDGSINASYPKVKSLQQDYLEEAKSSIAKVRAKKTEYSSVVGDENRYVFADGWKELSPVDASLLNKECEISEIFSSRVYSAIASLNLINNDLEKDIPADILNFSINDLLSKELLFQIDSYLSPLIKSPRSKIYELRNTLKALEVLYGQTQTSQSLLDRYGIRLSDVDSSKALVLEAVFLEKYKNIFRVFSKQYKNDRSEVSSWCLLRKPEKYAEIRDIVFCLSHRIKAQRRYDEDWNKIISDYSLGMDVVQLPFDKIANGINNLISYFENRNIEHVEPILKDNISNSLTHSALVQKVEKLKDVVTNAGLLRGITDREISECRICDISKTIADIEKETGEIKTKYETICPFIKSKDCHPHTIDSLNSEIAVLNQASRVIDSLKSTRIHDYLDASAEDLLLSNKAVDDLASWISFVEGFLPYMGPQFLNKTPTDLKMVMLSLVSNSQLINDWYYKFDTHIEKIANLFENTETKNYMFSKKYQEIVDDISQMAADSSGLERWIEYKKKKHALEEMGMDWFIKEGARLSMDENTNIAEVYSWSFFNKWVDEYSESHPELRDFTLEKYSKAIRDFKNLEKESMEINRLRTLHSQIESLDQSIVPCEAERVLRREATKKMRHLPIRSLVQDYASHIQLMKPCWMVSPLALSSYLEYGKVNFDVVIFDEASQMKIENALGAIARSKQVVVIGDEHQLPPTSFFGVSLEGDEDEDDDVNEETGFESILQKSISMLNGSEAYLKYHYRSSSEDLIAFSNYHIYGNRLITFPNPQNSSGVEFKFVKGVYDGSVITYSESGEKEKHAGARTNLIEAEEVANLCISHAQERPGKTLGVIAFSKAQEQAIRDALEEKLSKEYPHLSEYLDETSDKKDSFFIKNLESVQGDERDVIILSICYGPNKLGEVRNHFGPINSASGYRRLNVAVTRAKDKLICVTSMRFSDMNPSPSARGAILLQKYLEYAEKGWKVLEGNLIANSGIYW
jgi:hypothetical protein